MGLPKSRFSAIQSDLNAAEKLIADLLRFTHRSISSYVIEVLHCLPIVYRIKFKVILLVSKFQLGFATSRLTDFVRKPMSSVSARTLRSTDRLDLFRPSCQDRLGSMSRFSCDWALHLQ